MPVTSSAPMAAQALCGENWASISQETPGEQPDLGAAAITDRIQKRIGDRRVKLHEIHWISAFRPNIRIAERYRSGRVFLAGDAAHVHTPAGAQGLNTGIQDAYNLGWKLAQVLAGADARLLDSYEAERWPIAAHVLALSTKKYYGLAKLDPSSIRRGKDEKQLALSYHGGPLALNETDRTVTLRVGDRAPDADMVEANGEDIRLFSAYRGPHFTAIAYGDRAALDLNRLDWPIVGAPLKRIVIGGTASQADYVLTDAAHTFRRVYGVTSDTLFLIRPDGYIGHIATQNVLTTTQTAATRLAPLAAGAEMGHVRRLPDGF